MAVPWMRLLDAAIGVVNLARSRKEPAPGNPSQELEAGGRVFGGLETRLAGVMVAALKEAFDRDTRRLELEREHLEAERRRAEQALKLEMLRQAADREVGRLRLLSAVAAASWLATLFFATRFIGGALSARVLVGAGWALLLTAIALSFVAQTAMERALRGALDPFAAADSGLPSGTAGQTVPWLIVGGLGLIGMAVLI